MVGSALPDPDQRRQRLGRYEIVDRIASGGMGVVYLARMAGPRDFVRKVAIKVTHAHLAELPELAQELVEEAKIASLISHPNVLPVLEVGEDRGCIFLVMDYVEGASLATLLGFCKKTERKLPDGVALRILLDALAGLHAAHELTDQQNSPLELVHRDFSPQNILVAVTGNARLTDFGIAKARNRVGHTATGFVKGKTAYMSPEQARGKALTRSADIFAAGIVAWECFAGARFRPAENDAERVLRLVSEPGPLLSSARAGVPAALDEAIATALAIAADERFPTAHAMASALLSACEGFATPATPEEVGSWVSLAAGDRIEELRRSFLEPAEASSPSMPVEQPTVASPAEPVPTVATRLTSVSAATAVGASSSAPSRRYGALVGLVAVGLLGFGVHSFTKSSPEPMAAGAAPSATEIVVSATASEPASTSPTPVVTRVSASAPSATDVAASSAAIIPTAAIRPRAAPPKESAAKPKLPRNPYGG